MEAAAVIMVVSAVEAEIVVVCLPTISRRALFNTTCRPNLSPILLTNWPSVTAVGRAVLARLPCIWAVEGAVAPGVPEAKSWTRSDNQLFLWLYSLDSTSAVRVAMRFSSTAFCPA